jgi:hypothetical protein
MCFKLGKTKVIQNLILSAKVNLGKPESVCGHVLVITPTGSSGFTAGGTTWQAALCNTGGRGKKNPKVMTKMC